MIKSKFVKAFILSMCLSLFSAAAVNAAVTEGEQKEAAGGGGEIGITMVSGSPDEAVASRPISEAMLKKQMEIDTYLFQEHQKALEQKGITVTHTAPFDTYVEIGIMPLNDENAEYLYGIFGKDTVKVVDGEKVITMSAMGTPEPAPDLAQQGNAAEEPVKDAEIYNADDVKRDVKNETSAGSEADGRVYKTTGVQEDAQIYTTAGVPERGTDKFDSTLLITISAAGAVVLLGGTAVLLRKRKAAVR